MNKLRSQSAPAGYSRYKSLYPGLDILPIATRSYTRETKQRPNNLDEETRRWISSIEKRVVRSDIKIFLNSTEALQALQRRLHPPGSRGLNRNEAKLSSLQFNDLFKVLKDDYSSKSYRLRGKETTSLFEETVADKRQNLYNLRKDFLRDDWSSKLVIPESRAGQSFRILQKTYKKEDKFLDESSQGDLTDDVFEDEDLNEESQNKLADQTTNVPEEESPVHYHGNNERGSKSKRQSRKEESRKGTVETSYTRSLDQGRRSRKHRGDEDTPLSMRNIVKSALWRSHKATRYPPTSPV